MKNHKKNRVFILAFMTAMVASSLTACQLRPQLKQVARDAPDKPINTQEVANQLKKK